MPSDAKKKAAEEKKKQEEEEAKKNPKKDEEPEVSKCYFHFWVQIDRDETGRLQDISQCFGGQGYQGQREGRGWRVSS